MSVDVVKASLGRLDYLAAGGQAKVYRVPDFTLNDAPGPLVYKEYLKRQVSPFGLRAIVAVREQLSPADRANLDQRAAWPLRVVTEGTDVVGVVMPLIPDSFFRQRVLPSGRPSRDPVEIQYLFVPPERCVRIGMPDVPHAARLAACRDLAAVLELLHEHGVVFGDVNAKNALFRTGSSPTIMLVDCDAVRIAGSAAVVKQLNAPDWEPPEGAVLTRRTDLYKLGLFVIRALSPGLQASTSRNPDRIAGMLDDDGMRLLSAALSADPRARPEAREWREYFAARTNGLARANSTSVAAAESHPGWRRDPATGRWVLAG